MSSARKKKSISDQINEALKPKELVEETDEVEARFEEFTELGDLNNQLSDIRKQTARSLNELDSKYKGKAVSRKELEEENLLSGDDSGSDEDDQNGNAYATDSDDSMDSGNEEASDVEEEAEDEEESAEDDEEVFDESAGSEDDLGDDCDLSQFTKPQPSTSRSTDMPLSDDKTELLKNKSVNEEIKKGICVRNQLKIWEKLLEVRIKSQKMLITANSLPDFDAHLELSTMDDAAFSEKVESTCDGLHGLLDNLLELQSTLVSR